MMLFRRSCVAFFIEYCIASESTRDQHGDNEDPNQTMDTHTYLNLHLAHMFKHTFL